MARTKRTSQLSAGSKQQPSSPEYVPDDDEIENMPPATQAPATPTPSSTKRRVREDANPTPSYALCFFALFHPPVLTQTNDSPAKKKSRVSASVANASTSVVGDSDEEDDSGTASSISESTEAGDADVEDDGETPKASKMLGKKKATNLKTQLGGKLGVNAADELPQPSQSDPATAPIITLPSSAFTLENKAQWADSYVDSSLKTVLIVKARAADDALLPNKDILDAYMTKHGHYQNLPNANYVALLHRFDRQGSFANASTVDVTELAFKEAWSGAGPGCAYTACDKVTGRPITFLMVGGVMESFLVSGKNVGYDGKAPCAKGTPQTPDGARKVGKMEVKTYKSRDGSPSKPVFGGNKTYIDWSEKVPVYDGRSKAFDPNDIAGSLARLPDYEMPLGKIPEGTGVVAGYTASTSKFLSVWKLTFNIMWVVVIAD
ncbi:hypothetical protein H1R20_g12886, partial [Candolleomyces eurysporus]